MHFFVIEKYRANICELSRIRRLRAVEHIDLFIIAETADGVA